MQVCRCGLWGGQHQLLKGTIQRGGAERTRERPTKHGSPAQLPGTMHGCFPRGLQQQIFKALSFASPLPRWRQRERTNRTENVKTVVPHVCLSMFNQMESCESDSGIFIASLHLIFKRKRKPKRGSPRCAAGNRGQGLWAEAPAGRSHLDWAWKGMGGHRRQLATP